jgi:hypothetical protein
MFQMISEICEVYKVIEGIFCNNLIKRIYVFCLNVFIKESSS